MGDFEEVFGPGADFSAIVDGISRSAMREAEQEREEWDRFVRSVFVDARIEADGYSLFFKSYDEAIEFEEASKTYGKFDYSFIRRREGSGFRVEIEKDSRTSYFRRDGRIIVTASLVEATAFASISTAPIFEAVRPIGAMKSAFDYEKYGEDLKEWSKIRFRRCISETSCQTPDSRDSRSIIEAVDAGLDVVVFGSHLLSILEMRTRFIGWYSEKGFAAITDESALLSYQCSQFNNMRFSFGFR